MLVTGSQLPTPTMKKRARIKLLFIKGTSATNEKKENKFSEETNDSQLYKLEIDSWLFKILDQVALDEASVREIRDRRFPRHNLLYCF